MGGYKPLRAGIALSEKGAADGVAELDANGLLEPTQAPFVGAGMIVQGAGSRYTRTPGGPLTTYAPSAGEGTCTFIAFAFSGKLDRIGVNVTSAGEAGSKVRLLIHGPVLSSRDLTGGAAPLLLNAGVVAGDATGFKEITGLTQTFDPGVYLLSAVMEDSATTRPTLSALGATSHGNPYATYLTALPTAAYNGYRETSYTTFTAPPVGNGQAQSAVAVFLRLVAP